MDLVYTRTSAPVDLVYTRTSALTCIKPILTTDGKIGVLKVNTNLFVGFFTPSLSTLILQTSVSPCSPMNTRICSQVCLFKVGQRTIPLDMFLDMFKEECGVTLHLVRRSSSN